MLIYLYPFTKYLKITIFKYMNRVQIKPHPYIPNVLVRADGMIYVPAKRNFHGTWTFGSKTSTGYLRVKINGKEYRVHRLVAETFIPNKEHKPIIDHIDRNREHNDIWNLRWVTYKENSNNMITNSPLGKRKQDYETSIEWHRVYTREWYRTKKLNSVSSCP